MYGIRNQTKHKITTRSCLEIRCTGTQKVGWKIPAADAQHNAESVDRAGFPCEKPAAAFGRGKFFFIIINYIEER